jgi:hypothetical protein
MLNGARWYKLIGQKTKVVRCNCNVNLQDTLLYQCDAWCIEQAPKQLAPNCDASTSDCSHQQVEIAQV